eukprot:gene13223-13354_t
MGSMQQLHACGLNSLSLLGNALSGHMTEDWGLLTNLVTLNLGKNFIAGTIPDALQNVHGLLDLCLDSNLMYGTIPEWLDKMPGLMSLSLAAFLGRGPDGRLGLTGTLPSTLAALTQLFNLNLPSNSLAGTIPTGLCHPQMRAIVLFDNRLSGGLNQFFSCQYLAYLDLRNNKFNGSLPDMEPWPWMGLDYLDLRSNDFEGTLPAGLFTLWRLVALYLGHNRFHGTIPSSISSLPFLLLFVVSHNQFSGSIEEAIYYSPSLSTLDLSHNQFTGTISPALGSGYYLLNVDLRGNQLTGALPAELGLVKPLLMVDVRNNSLSCNRQSSTNSSGSSNTSPQCVRAELLPCFLTLSTDLFPRPDKTHMRCPQVFRKPFHEAQQDCQSPGQGSLGDDQSSRLPDLDLTAGQTWNLDPSYFQYTNCECLGGYHETWTNNHTVLVCESDKPNQLPAWVVPLAAILVAVLILAAAVALLLWVKMTARLRRKWQRDKELQKSRLKGIPKDCLASIVVTDVEHYSDLMQRDASLCMRAMGTHNGIMRKAVTAHAGHVIEQEGDSWSIAFHRPVDAVAFCLQVQQALQKCLWPDGLCNSHERTPGSAGASAAQSHANLDDNTAPVAPQRSALSMTSSTLAAGAAALADLGKGTSKSSPGKMRVLSKLPSSGNARCESSTQEGSAAEHSAERSSGSIATSQGGWRRFSVIGGDSAPTHPAAQPQGIRGLRVRMGVASGWLAADSDICTSPMFELAKGVSDIANGGQVLLEAGTFAAVRDWLAELGTVDHKGYNEALAAAAPAATVAAHSTVSRWLLGCLFNKGVNSTDPFLLDMGLFAVPNLASSVAALQAPDARALAQPTNKSGRAGLAANTLLPDQADAGSRQPAATTDGIVAGGVPSDRTQCHAGSGASACLQLYSILARPLHTRGKVWKSKLNHTTGTQQMSRGYFDAPGATEASLIPEESGIGIKRPLQLPPVTIVFAAVQGGKQLVQRKERAAAVVHQALSKVMQVVLLALPDGYLCREQEGALKYLLAFKEPARAAEWCLLMQEVLRHVPWAAEVQDSLGYLDRRRTGLLSDGGGHRRSTVSYSGAKCRPMLKMGLAEGVPEDVTPDFLGRADYFGMSVNMAARMMDAAAVGGQVVLSSDTAEGIFSTWRAEVTHGCAAITEEICGNSCPAWQFSLSGASPLVQQNVAAAPLEESPDARAVISRQPNPGTCETDVLCTLALTHNTDVLQAQPATTEESAADDVQQQWPGATGTLGGGQAAIPPCKASFPAAEPRSTSGSVGRHQMPERYELVPTPLAALGNGTSNVNSNSPQQSQRRLVHVTAHNTGTYAFKGCGAVDMVCLTCEELRVLPEVQDKACKGSKGTLLMASSGAVLGLQDCPVTLPQVLTDLEQTWRGWAVENNNGMRRTSQLP